MAGAPKGNTNGAKKNLIVTDTLRIVVTQDRVKLRKGLEKLLDAASEGDMGAMTFIADRLDGKPKQAVEMSEDPDAPLFSMLANAAQLRDKIRGK